MDPLTLALILGPQVISGAMQYSESKASREYAAEQEARLQDALNKIGIPEARPEYFTPEVYQWLENYDPEVAAYVRERDPTMVKLRSSEAEAARKAEENVLQNLLARSREGTDVLAEIQRSRGMREAAGTMASQAATLQQQLQRQGQQGGLAAYGAALQQQQGAGMQAALAAEQAALSGLQERGRALSEAGTLSGRQLGRELDIESANVNAINAFNQRLAQSQQEQANLAAEIRNKANLYNIAGRQSIGEKNIRAKTEAADRQRAFEQQAYENELGKYNRQVSGAGRQIQQRQDQATDVNRLYQGLGDLASTAGYMRAGSAPRGGIQGQADVRPSQTDAFGGAGYQEAPNYQDQIDPLTGKRKSRFTTMDA